MAEGTWTVLRFVRMLQRGEWWTVAAVAASGGDERSGVLWGEEQKRGERAASEGEERGASRRLQARDWVDGERDTAKQEVARSGARAGCQWAQG